MLALGGLTLTPGGWHQNCMAAHPAGMEIEQSARMKEGRLSCGHKTSRGALLISRAAAILRGDLHSAENTASLPLDKHRGSSCFPIV